MSGSFYVFSLQRLYIAFVVTTCLLGGPITSAYSAEPTLTAVLSSSQTGVGQPVELQIKVSGVRSAGPPAEISVDGLEIQSAGQVQSFEMRNMDVSSSVTFNYTIVPTRTGTFRIPSV